MASDTDARWEKATEFDREQEIDYLPHIGDVIEMKTFQDKRGRTRVGVINRVDPSEKMTSDTTRPVKW